MSLCCLHSFIYMTDHMTDHMTFHMTYHMTYHVPVRYQSCSPDFLLLTLLLITGGQ